MKKVYWLIFVGLLLGCGSEAAPTAVPSPPPPTRETVLEAEIGPTATAVPPKPTDTPIPPTATAVPPTATAEPQAVPEIVWLPYAVGNLGEPVLMLEDDNVVYREIPVEVDIFFGYAAGWLAYGSYFWEPTADQQSVTDLYIYNFATDTDQLWADGRIGRAALSPVNEISGQPTVAVAVSDGSDFDLVVMLGPDNSVPLVEGMDPYFSWSPDGSQIAYLRDHDLFITSAAGVSGDPPIASDVYRSGQWIGDAPLWLGSSGYLLYAETPFVIAAADGSGTFVPTAENGTPLEGPRPLAMLYSSTTNQLIAEIYGMFGSNLAIYQFGDGFKTAELTQQIDDAQLAGWYEENESIIIVSSDGEATVLPLTPQE